MGKKRRTKSQKIIAELRRQLGKQPIILPPVKISVPELTMKEEKEKEIIVFSGKKEEQSFLIAPQLIKKDLFKTLILSLVFLSLILLVKQFFHL